jgi:hypothetical protein
VHGQHDQADGGADTRHSAASRQNIGEAAGVEVDDPGDQHPGVPGGGSEERGLSRQPVATTATVSAISALHRLPDLPPIATNCDRSAP